MEYVLIPIVVILGISTLWLGLVYADTKAKYVRLEYICLCNSVPKTFDERVDGQMGIKSKDGTLYSIAEAYEKLSSPYYAEKRNKELSESKESDSYKAGSWK